MRSNYMYIYTLHITRVYIHSLTPTYIYTYNLDNIVYVPPKINLTSEKSGLLTQKCEYIYLHVK